MVNKYLYPKAGAETYMLELSRSLIKAGHEVAFFGMNHPELTKLGPTCTVEEVYFGDKKPKSRRTVRRSPVRRSPVRRSPVRRSQVRRSPVKRRTVRRSPVRRSPVKRSPVKRRTVRRSPVRKSPARKSLKPPRGKFCEPKEKKFPVNTKARCSSALSYARYSKDPCKIARCVNKNCEKSVGRYSKLMKECGLRK